MIIVKHKSVNMTTEEIMQAAVEHNPPAGTVIDITVPAQSRSDLQERSTCSG